MSLHVKSKIWLENDEGRLIIGTGRVRILEAIERLGSMNKAAAEVKQPFRAVWGKIRATEQRCGFKLVQTTSGGSSLTQHGRELLDAYRALLEKCRVYADDEFRRLFPASDEKD
jgi:molybdate transport system regulatory protein